MKGEIPANNSYEDGWEDSGSAARGEDQLPIVAVTSGPEELGPCLFLGPAGERCSRRALEGGFCGVHQPGGIAKLIAAPGRVFAATITIVVLLWPYIADLVREIIRWMAAH
jgi:hypothetical protein